MNFRPRKFPREAAPDLIRCPLESIVPYSLMLAPAYFYMQKNEKFVGIKGPLDFFTPEELGRLAVYRSIYFTKFIDEVKPYRDAARSVAALLGWKPPQEMPSAKLKDRQNYPPVPLAISPYELSDAVLRILSKLWAGEALAIESFFVVAFVEELCAPIPEQDLREAREKSVKRLERALCESSWTVFLALHLGFCELEFVNDLRLRAFRESVKKSSMPGVNKNYRSEVELLIAISRRFFDEAEGVADPAVHALQADRLGGLSEVVGQRMLSRIERMRRELVKAETKLASVAGENGFVEGADV